MAMTSLAGYGFLEALFEAATFKGTLGPLKRICGYYMGVNGVIKILSTGYLGAMENGKHYWD